MNKKRLTTLSKFLSKYLRHEPQNLGLTLSPGGWVSVEDLLTACQGRQFSITLEDLWQVVETSDKKRFAFDKTGTLIRANQGHSTPVDLLLEPQTPPAILYHGTAIPSVPAILATGLQKMSRHHVHLSTELDTARKVGSRHGRPAILQVNAAAMAQAGYTFYCSTNGVWLVEQVPVKYLQSMPDV